MFDIAFTVHQLTGPMTCLHMFKNRNKLNPKCLSETENSLIIGIWLIIITSQVRVGHMLEGFRILFDIILYLNEVK